MNARCSQFPTLHHAAARATARRRRLLSLTGVAAVSALAAAPLHAAVVPDGSFVHAVEIKLPPGTNGMAPKLSLGYSSYGGNGPFGVGWRLNGLPVISRVSYGYGINYNGNDTYSAEGAGRLVKQTDGSFFPETWTGGKYVPYGTCGDGPCMWVLRGGSGVDMYFGGLDPASPATDHSSRIKHLTAVRIWALAKVVNTRDNTSYEVAYVRDTARGTYYPGTITYTKAPGIAAYKTVKFLTEARADAGSAFPQGELESWNQRINRIQVSQNGKLLREYAITYESSGSSGRSRITRVQELGSAGGTLPAQTFAWSEESNTTGWKRWMTGYPEVVGDAVGTAQWFEGDFDGDGRTDRIKVKQNGAGTAFILFRSDGTALQGQPSVFSSQWVSTDTSQGNSQWFAGDFTGDGTTDLAKIWNENGQVKASVYESTGGSFTERDWTSDGQGSWISTNSAAGNSQWFAADFNGDGRMDLGVVRNQNNAMTADVHLSTGSTFAWARWASAQGGWVNTSAPNGESQWFAADFNGDGKADLAKIWNSGGLMTADVHLAVGNGFEMHRWATGQGGWVSTNVGAGTSQWFIGDFNGDGKTDLAKIWKNENSNMNVDVHLATGTAFAMERWGTDQGGWINSNVGDNTSQWFTGDFNGDGKTDLAAIWGCSAGGMCMDVHASLNGVFGIHRWATAQGGWIGSKDSQWFVGDLNGDGRTDLANVFNENSLLSSDAHLSDGQRPDLVTTIGNGIGGVTTIEYAQSLSLTFPNGCGVGVASGVWQTSAATGNNAKCGIPNTAPKALALRVRTDTGRPDDPGRFRSMSYSYANPRVRPGGFDEDDYRARYPDVASSVYGQVAFGMEYHYVEHGRAEGRYMRLRNLDLGFEKYTETDEQIGTAVKNYFRQDAPFQTRLGLSFRDADPGSLEEQYSYTSWTPFTGVTGINDSAKTSIVREAGTVAHTVTQTKTVDTYGFATRIVDDAGEGYTITTDSKFTHDAANWKMGRLDEMKKYRTNNLNILDWEKVRYNSDGRVDLKQHWLCDNAASCLSGSFVTTASGHVYDAWGNLTSVKDARGIAQSTEYDTTYRAFVTRTVVDPTGLNLATVRTYGLLDGTNADSVTDPAGGKTITTNDQFGRKISVQSPLGGLEQYTYNSYGSVGMQFDETVTTVDTRQVHKRTYFDGNGRVFRTESTGDDGKTIVTESEDYIGDGQARVTQDSRPHYAGSEADYVTVLYDRGGRQSQITLPDGSVTTYDYGPGSVTVTETVNGRAHSTTEFLTPRGRMWKKVDSLGGAEVLTYDEMQRVTKVQYQGKTVATTVYDSFGQRRSVRDYSSGSGKATSFKYDAAGNQTDSTDPRGNAVKFTYDNIGRIKTKQRMLSGATAYTTDVTFTYDDPAVANSKGRLTKVVDPSGTTEFGYDQRGRVTTRKSTIKGLSQSLLYTMAYDAIGRSTRLTFPNGKVQETKYTDAGNISQVLYDGVQYASMSGYSARGKPSVKKTPHTSTTYGFNTQDMVESLLTVGGAGQEVQHNTYAYDEIGNVTAINDLRANKTVGGINTDETQAFGFDQGDRLVTAKGRYGGVSGTIKKFGYDGGTAGSTTQPAGLGTTTAFGGLVNRTMTFTGQQVTSATNFTATYDASGNMITKAEDGKSWAYTFDYDNHLTQVKQSGVVVLDVVYNYQGDRVKKIYHPGGGRTITTYYDGGGFEVRTDSSTAGTYLRTVHVTAGASGKIATITTSGTSPVTAMLTGAQRRALIDAADGSSIRGLADKLFNLGLARLELPGAIPAATMSALALVALLLALALFSPRLTGRAVRRPAWARPRFALAHRLAMVPLLLVMAFNVTGCGRDGSIDDTESSTNDAVSGNTRFSVPVGTWFYHPSQIGSSSAITDGSGNLVTYLNYLPFGEVDNARSWGTDKVTHKFTGQELDEETGLVYYGARYYDPAVGKFLSADSVVPGNGNNAQSFNRYAYADNNPVTYTDPTGHWTWKGLWDVVLTITVVAVIVALSVMTAGAIVGALALGAFWGAVVAGAISGALINGAFALRNGASLSDALTAAFQGAIVGAIGGGVGQYVEGIGGLTGSLGEKVAVGGARGLATSGASAYMKGARGSELIKASLFGAASGMAVSAVVYGVDKLADAFASKGGINYGKENTFGNGVGDDRFGAHDMSVESQRRYIYATTDVNEETGEVQMRTYGDGFFTEGGDLSRLGYSLGLNPTSQVHDGIQGWVNTHWGSAIADWTNVPAMPVANLVASIDSVGKFYPEAYTTMPRYQIGNPF